MKLNLFAFLLLAAFSALLYIASASGTCNSAGGAFTFISGSPECSSCNIACAQATTATSSLNGNNLVITSVAPNYTPPGCKNPCGTGATNIVQYSMNSGCTVGTTSNNGITTTISSAGNNQFTVAVSSIPCQYTWSCPSGNCVLSSNGAFDMKPGSAWMTMVVALSIFLFFVF